jgi:flagella basal body P-ring formation protein FlgA
LRAERRSVSFVPVLPLLLAAVWLGLGGPALAQSPEAEVETAVAVAADAVRLAFGGDAEVTLTRPVLHLADGSGPIVRAVPEPSSRTAGLVRFVLYAAAGPRARRVGRLTADVRVSAPHVRVVGDTPARTTLVADAMSVVRDDIGRQAFGPLPTIDVVAGAETRKPLADGDVVTRAALVARPLVATGEEVVTIARVGALEVRGRAIASQAGDLGDTVVVVNPDSRKRLHARVVGSAVVEVRHGS